MNKIKVLDVLLMQYADYFVNKAGYMLLQVTNIDGVYNWLLNPKNDKFPIIILSTESFANAYGHDETFSKVVSKIAEQFNITGRRLELYFQDETGIPDVGYDFQREAISLGTNPSKEVIDIFPGIDEVAKPIDTTKLNEQFFALSKSTNQGSNQRIKEITREKYLNNQPMKKPIATYVVMGICLVIYLAKVYLMNVCDITDEVAQVIMLGGYYKGFILGMNEWFRLLTGGFVHVELLHFLMNMFALYNLGIILESVYGAKKMLTVLIGSIIYGNLLVLVVQGNSVSNGLSGGLYGLFAMIALHLLKTGAFKNRQFLTKVLSIVAINIGISLLPDVSLYAHLGGFVAGGAISFILMNEENWKSLRPHIIICLAVMTAAMVYLGINAQLDVAYGLTDLTVAQGFNKLGLTGYSERIIEKMTEYYTTHGF